MDALIGEVGMCFHIEGKHTDHFDFVGFIDDLYVDGTADYRVDFSKEKEEFWPGTVHREISQFTKLKGNTYLADGQVHIACGDFGEITTGRHDWTDYTAEFAITPVTGTHHIAVFRSQGAMRSYGVGFDAAGRLTLFKNKNGYQAVVSKAFEWEYGKEYKIAVNADGNVITAWVEGESITWTDDGDAYLHGGVGLAVLEGSHMSCSGIRVK